MVELDIGAFLVKFPMLAFNPVVRGYTFQKLILLVDDVNEALSFISLIEVVFEFSLFVFIFIIRRASIDVLDLRVHLKFGVA